MTVVKTFIKYPGGKSRLLLPIIERLPESEHFFDTFCGGGSVSIAYAQKYPNSIIHMNDFDKYTYAIWEVIINGSEEDILKLSNYVMQIPSIDLFRYNRGRLNTTDLIERAYLGIFFHKCTFSGMFNGNPIGGFEQKSIWKVGCHYTSKNIISKMIGVRKLLRGRTIVSNLDFRNINFNGSLIYFDPPYVSVGDKLYSVSFSEKDHRDLSDIIKKIDTKWLLSYNDHPLVRELYSDFEIESFNHSISMSSFCEGKKCRVKTELLITKH